MTGLRRIRHIAAGPVQMIYDWTWDLLHLVSSEGMDYLNSLAWSDVAYVLRTLHERRDRVRTERAHTFGLIKKVIPFRIAAW